MVPGSLIRALVAIFVLTYPLENFHYELAGYPLTVPFFALCLLFGALLWHSVVARSVVWPIATATLLFVGWAVAGAIFVGKSSSLVSLAVFAVLYGIIAFRMDIAGLQSTVIRWTIRGSLLALGFAGHGILASFGILPSLSELLPGLAEQSTYAIGGLQRVSGSFSEPSHFARYLVFILMFLDIVRLRGVQIGHERILRLSLILVLLLTVSIAGWILYAAYLGVSWIHRLIRRYGSVTAIPRRKRVAPILIAMSLLAVGLIPQEIRSAFLEYGAVRAENLVSAVIRGELDSSEGSRLNAFGASLHYATSGRLREFLIGEGFNEYEALLQARYAKSNSALERGTVQNIFAAVTLGTGIVGLVLYAFLLLSIYWARVRLTNVEGATGYFLIWVLSHLATGQLIVYTFPGYLLWMLWLSPGEYERTS